MDQAARTHVLLEAVAQVQEARRRTPEARGLAAAGRAHGPQPQELLAPLPNDGDALGPERLVAGSAGPGLRARHLDRFPLPGIKSVRETCHPW